ncbi:hypothetical protein [Roseibium sp.]|uniref:hypothetical protein n=1 Tax=Roseibium sp. TaxID=1936156 RepID=UPI003A96D5F7
MTTRIHATEDRHSVARPIEGNLSTIGQIDRGENEGMAISADRSSSKGRTTQEHDETTTLERRVLAHERVLQSLIAHMTETDPRFVERLREKFCFQIKYREQDYTDTDDYAEEFVRAIEDAVRRQHSKTELRAGAADPGQIAPEML